MILNIYNGKQIVKTYEADEYDLLFGVLEDVAAVIKLDELKEGSDAEIIKMIGGAVLASMDTVKDLLKDIFAGVTDAELRNTRVSEIAAVLLDVVKYTLKKLNSLKSKN